jgi:hypothetical protein
MHRVRAHRRQECRGFEVQGVRRTSNEEPERIDGSSPVLITDDPNEGAVVTEGTQGHATSLTMTKGFPAELDAGAGASLKVKVACLSHCNLQGGKVRIADDTGGVLIEAGLSAFDGTANETDEFVVKAPIDPGEYRWTALFAALDQEGVVHEESSAPFSFVVKPHSTSLAVWDLPSPVVRDTGFKLKVGVKCSAECKLTGRAVEVYNQEGVKIAMGALGELPWASTRALYWTDVELQAPGTEGFHRWTAKFPIPDLELPHECASNAFAFGTVKPPEHIVTVEVIDQATRAPIKNAVVTLHSNVTPFRYTADASGVITASVPKGEYNVYVWSNNHEEFRTIAVIIGDLAIQAELIPLPVDAN